MAFTASTCMGQNDALLNLVVLDPFHHESPIEELEPAALAAMLGKPNVHVFDCNDADLYAEMHVPGARLIEYDHVTRDLLPTDNTAILVFYCYSRECPASHTAAVAAHDLGYTHVYFMLEGILGWMDAQLPTEP
jgi:rhodanese-related sulfurtransferase